MALVGKGEVKGLRNVSPITPHSQFGIGLSMSCDRQLDVGRTEVSLPEGFSQMGFEPDSNYFFFDTIARAF